MIDFLRLLACALTTVFRSRARLEAQILVLRHVAIMLLVAGRPVFCHGCVETDELGSPERAGETDQQQGSIPTSHKIGCRSP